MRKVFEVLIIVAVLVLVASIFTGCTPSSSDQLLKPTGPVSDFARKWIAEYGEGQKSIEHYNIALIRELTKRQAKTIDELRGEVVKLEKELAVVKIKKEMAK